MATAVVPQAEEGEGTAKEEEVPQEYHQLYRKRESAGWKQIKSHWEISNTKNSIIYFLHKINDKPCVCLVLALPVRNKEGNIESRYLNKGADYRQTPDYPRMVHRHCHSMFHP